MTTKSSHCDNCGRKLRICSKFPLRCSCGAVYGKNETRSIASKKKKEFLGVGSEIRKMLGCGCRAIPFRDWDLKGVEWCEHNIEYISNTIAASPQSGADVGAAMRIVIKAISKAGAANKAVALIVPDQAAWAGPARGGVFQTTLLDAGYKAVVYTSSDARSLSIDTVKDFDIVCNHAMVARADAIRILSENCPETTFVNINHSALGHVEKSGGGYTGGFLQSLQLARDLPNCWYASQGKSAMEISQATGIERCIWLPTPANLLPPRKYRLPAGKAVVVIAGRHDPIKNNLTQIVACGLLKDDVKLVLCMDPNNQMQEMIDLIGIDHEWMGCMPHADWVQFLRDVPDVVLCCSLAESFGYVAVEAMQTGVPVIGSNAIRFAHPDLLATQGNPKEIAGKIKMALDQGEKYQKECAEIGRGTAEDQNSEYVRKIRKLLRSRLPKS